MKTGYENPCKLCTPLGACLCFKGIEGAMVILHGSQGCSTYIRRYLIGHFREPVDIASSSFHEETAIFGGAANLHKALENVNSQYAPALLGVATTCLSETVGENIPLILHEFQKKSSPDFPPIVTVSTASYRDTHREGFHHTVREITERFYTPGGNLSPDDRSTKQIAIFPGMLSPQDLRWIRGFVSDFGLEPILVPDYSETLDGGLWDDFHMLPPGGTPVSQLKNLGSCRAIIELGRALSLEDTAGTWLSNTAGIQLFRLGAPMGLEETDTLSQSLMEISGQDLPGEHRRDRRRYMDALVDAHKYTAGSRALVYGDEDLVLGMVSFLRESGVTPVICGTGGYSGTLKQALATLLTPKEIDQMVVIDDKDFSDLEELASSLGVTLVVGNSKGYKTAKHLGVPLFRVGFPVHDRFGAGRLLHAGYRGALELLDRLINLIIENRQEASPVGYTYQ